MPKAYVYLCIGAQSNGMGMGHSRKNLENREREAKRDIFFGKAFWLGNGNGIPLTIYIANGNAAILVCLRSTHSPHSCLINLNYTST